VGSSWNGRASTGAPQALVAPAAQASAASRSAALMTQKPPSCSLVSANGPSVVSYSPSRTRTTVAVSGGNSPPPNTKAPSACSLGIERGDLGVQLLDDLRGRLGLASTMCTDNRYCFIALLV
jgi:hypothetical protein